MNSDDFYGQEAFAVIGKYLSGTDIKDGAIVPYKLEPTLSPQGTVARGVCEISGGYLKSVDELLAIQKKDGKIYNTAPDGSIRLLDPQTPVSMNFWGFPELVLPHLKKYFEEFIAASGKELKSECYLPKAADWFIQKDLIKIRSLEANSQWFGVTYKEDREFAVKHLAELRTQGIYPDNLWV